jgi:hypothetical protein
MPRDKLTFRERDLSSALKVLRARGLRVSRVEIRPDGVVIIPCDGGDGGGDAELNKHRKVLENAAQRVKNT